MLIRIKAKIIVPKTNIILLGSLAFMGTAAHWISVKAGVFSCILAFAAWS